MEAVRSKVMSIFGKKDNVVHLLLLGSFVALGVRSAEQQREIEALEAEKSSLRSGNKAMASTLWESRQLLFGLVEADPAAAPVPLARLRSIFGEEQPAAVPSPSTLDLPGNTLVEDSTPIA